MFIHPFMFFIECQRYKRDRTVFVLFSSTSKIQCQGNNTVSRNICWVDEWTHTVFHKSSVISGPIFPFFVFGNYSYPLDPSFLFFQHSPTALNHFHVILMYLSLSDLYFWTASEVFSQAFMGLFSILPRRLHSFPDLNLLLPQQNSSI